jgi:hypothetical protein
MTDGPALQGIARAATLYRRGIFCPAVLWGQVTDRLAVDGAGRFLDAPPPDLQLVLREAYRDRPHSLRTGDYDESVCREVEDWCERADD